MACSVCCCLRCLGCCRPALPPSVETETPSASPLGSDGFHVKRRNHMDDSMTFHSLRTLCAAGPLLTLVVGWQLGNLEYGLHSDRA